MKRNLIKSKLVQGALVIILAIATLMQLRAETTTTDPYANETKAEKDARMAWFREAKFGMFIHWGVYSVPAGTYKGKKVPALGEWIMANGKIPMAEYQAYAKEFNPVKYDPDAWVRLAREAGVKYIVITAKHHDGFALFDSKVSKWDVVDATPYGKDLLKPLAEACQKYGIKLGFYYSQALDWNQGGAVMGGKKWDPAQAHDIDDYIQNIAVPQVKEILTHYGPICMIWWDIPEDMTQKRADQFLPLLKLQPGIIHNNRLQKSWAGGDTKTPEQHIPGTGLPGDWEACMTMNDTWGFKSYDNNWKSTEVLLGNLIDIASKGGNYLLNVGPTSEGIIPEPSIERLKAIGAWMKVNSESIYSTTASPCNTPKWGRITTKKKGSHTTLYLQVFEWPADGKLFLPVANKVESCYLLANPSHTFDVKTDEDGTKVMLTGQAPDAISSVVVLNIAGEPAVTAANLIRQKKDGTIFLQAARAVINNVHGSQVVYEKDKDCIGFWTHKEASVEWTFTIHTPGDYQVTAQVASLKSGELTVSLNGKAELVTVPASGSYMTFNPVDLGRFNLATAGEYTIKLKPAPEGWQPINLRSVELTASKSEKE